jgi:hypothetical protein
MGALVGAAAQGEVIWAGDERSEATRRRAEAGGFRDAGSVAALAGESEVVLSICPPAIADDVAAAVFDAGFEGLFVEANAIAPARMERIARRGRCVDGSIIASNGVNLYLAGDPADVADVAGLFSGGEVTAIPLEGGIGAASALKMAFGGWNKMGVALAAQAYAIARAYGVEGALAAEGVESRGIVRGSGKAWRWAPEMEEVADTAASLGLPDGMGRAAADLFRRWGAHRDHPAELDRLLEDLT